MLRYDNAIEFRRRPWQGRIEVYSPKLIGDRGRHAKFWILAGAESEADALPSTLHRIAVRVLHRADMIAAETRIKNWSQIVPYLISFRRHTHRRLQEDLIARVEKPHRLEQLEAAFQPIDVSIVRASLFKLLAEGRCQFKYGCPIRQ